MSHRRNAERRDERNRLNEELRIRRWMERLPEERRAVAEAMTQDERRAARLANIEVARAREAAMTPEERAFEASVREAITEAVRAGWSFEFNLRREIEATESAERERMLGDYMAASQSNLDASRALTDARLDRTRAESWATETVRRCGTIQTPYVTEARLRAQAVIGELKQLNLQYQAETARRSARESARIAAAESEQSARRAAAESEMIRIQEEAAAAREERAAWRQNKINRVVSGVRCAAGWVLNRIKGSCTRRQRNNSTGGGSRRR